MKTKTLLLVALFFTAAIANAQITYSMTIPDSIPEYDGTYEDFGQNHLFYPNAGEVRFADDELSDASSHVKYYTMNTWPKKYLLNDNNLSFVYAKASTAAGTTAIDSLHRIDIQWQSSNTSAFLARVDTQNFAMLNYFTQWFGSSGRTNVQGGAAIACQSIYNNIDLVYTSNNAGIVMYFIVYPGGNYNDILLHIAGSKANSISSNRLKIEANWDSTRFEKPKMYQYTISGNVVTPVNVCNASWQSVGGDTYKIYNTTTYNTSLPLIIQLKQAPALSASTSGLKWSTYFGGNQFDFLSKTHIDAADNLYVSGISNSPNFPIGNGGIQNTNSNDDGLFSKFNAAGQLQWSTFIGGASAENIHDFSVTGSSIYCVGKTGSSNLPVKSKTGATNNSAFGGGFWDGFILEIGYSGISGNVLSKNWLTYYGGNGADELNACKFDASGNFYVVGASSSSNWSPTGGAGTYQQSFNSAQLSQAGSSGVGVTDAIIAKFNTSSSETWFTFFGTDALGTNANWYAGDSFYDVAIDGTNVYACGEAGGTNLPNSINSKLVSGNFDGILAHFSTSGALNNTKFTDGNIANYAVTVHWNDVFTVGQANSAMSPVNSGNYYYNGSSSGTTDGCFSIHSSNLATTTHNTFLGGSSDDAAYDIKFATNNVFYIAGGTNSSNFPTYNLSPMYYNGTEILNDNFVACFGIGNTSLIWSTYLGSDFNESLQYPPNVIETYPLVNTSIALTSQNVLHLLGTSNSYNTFPLDNGGGIPYFQGQNANPGIGDGTITRFDVATINAIVGLKEFEKTEIVFGIYPNPAVKSLSIKNAIIANDDLHYAIFDMSGKKLKEGDLKASEAKNIDVSFLQKGLYVINVSNGKKTFSNKFIKTDN